MWHTCFYPQSETFFFTTRYSSNFLAALGGLSGRLQHHVENIVLTFVWKDDPFCPSLMQSPLLQTRIIGDVNIGCYLCQILYPQLYDENNIDNIGCYLY